MRIGLFIGLAAALLALPGCERGEREREAPRVERRANAEARIAKGPFIERTKAISQDEESRCSWCHAAGATASTTSAV